MPVWARNGSPAHVGSCLSWTATSVWLSISDTILPNQRPTFSFCNQWVEEKMVKAASTFPVFVLGCAVEVCASFPEHTKPAPPLSGTEFLGVSEQLFHPALPGQAFPSSPNIQKFTANAHLPIPYSPTVWELEARRNRSTGAHAGGRLLQVQPCPVLFLLRMHISGVCLCSPLPRLSLSLVVPEWYSHTGG